MNDFRSALRLSLPVLGAYLFLGITYGLLAVGMGYELWVPVLMAVVVYSGSVEFIALTLLMGAFHPLSALAMALMVGARHLFYAITMLSRWQGAGWRKPLLIYWMSDETFALNYANGGSYAQQLWVSVLDCLYWVSGAAIGYGLGSVAGKAFMQRLEGLDFVVTAMFAAIFMDNYLRHRHSRRSAWLGIGAAGVCLALFGSSGFIVPTMLCILAVLYLKYRNEKTPGAEASDVGKGRGEA